MFSSKFDNLTCNLKTDLIMFEPHHAKLIFYEPHSSTVRHLTHLG